MTSSDCRKSRTLYNSGYRISCVYLGVHRAMLPIQHNLPAEESRASARKHPRWSAHWKRAFIERHKNGIKENKNKNNRIYRESLVREQSDLPIMTGRVAMLPQTVLIDCLSFLKHCKVGIRLPWLACCSFRSVSEITVPVLHAAKTRCIHFSKFYFA